MRWSNDDVRYGLGPILLHWLTVALILGGAGLGLYMAGRALSPETYRLYALHKSIGVTILALALLRLAWRLVDPPPALPATMAPLERRAAHAGHALLYALLIAQPVIGILHSNAAGFPIVVWSALPLPAVIGTDRALVAPLATAHGLTALALGIVAAGHALVAIHHHVARRDAVLWRMLPAVGHPARRGEAEGP